MPALPTMPLSLLGWIFVVLCSAAIIAGGLVIIALHRAGELEKRMLTRTVFSDIILFGIWLLGLAGALGILAGKLWARDALEFFCWILLPLAVLSAGNRFYALQRESKAEPDVKVNWVGAISGIVVVLLPLVLLCISAIATLRSAGTLKALGG